MTKPNTSLQYVICIKSTFTHTTFLTVWKDSFSLAKERRDPQKLGLDCRRLDDFDSTTQQRLQPRCKLLRLLLLLLLLMHCFYSQSHKNWSHQFSGQARQWRWRTNLKFFFAKLHCTRLRCLFEKIHRLTEFFAEYKYTENVKKDI